MIKAPLLIRLLKQRLAHNETYLAQEVGIVGVLDLGEDQLDRTPGYRKAIEEENQFLRVVLEETQTTKTTKATRIRGLKPTEVEFGEMTLDEIQLRRED